MITIRKGNILDSKEDIIVQQVDKEGLRLSRVTDRIISEYPVLNNTYNDYARLAKVGDTLLVKVEDGKIVANSYSQTRKKLFGASVKYKALENSLKQVKNIGEKEHLDIALPYRIGCGRAKGDWGKVMDIITKVFEDYKYNVVVYK